MSRPVAHFTPGTGWVNDPYGVWWDGERYHLYFQAVPHGTEWAAECCWGHAVSTDLVAWQERPVALSPAPGEVGCWSGCVLPDAAGHRLAFYTSVRRPDLDRGSIAVVPLGAGGASRDGSRRTVIDGPPEGEAVRAFRDPFVTGGPGEWEMVVGGGLEGGSGCVFRFRSADLEHWTYAGLLHSGQADPAGGRRQVWECPQLVELDGQQVLIVSVQADGSPGAVVAATRPPGGTFGPWQILLHGDVGYATSAFHDRDGRPCLLSWLREHPAAGPREAWAGAESLVGLLSTDASGAALVTPHPAIARSAAFARDAVDGWPAVLDLATTTAARHLVAPFDAPIDLTVGAGGRELLRARRTTGALTVERAGELPERLPARGSAPFELFLDADLVEIFWAGSYGAWRLPR